MIPTLYADALERASAVVASVASSAAASATTSARVFRPAMSPPTVEKTETRFRSKLCGRRDGCHALAAAPRARLVPVRRLRADLLQHRLEQLAPGAHVLAGCP